MNTMSSKIEIFKDQKRFLGLLKIANFAFFIIGFLYCQSLLIYDGKTPVNIFYLFLFLILFQLGGTLLGVLFFDSIEKNPLFKFFEKILRYALKKLGVMPSLLTEKLLTKEFLLNSLFFNLGAVFGLMGKVAFFDVVFGWSTSINISPETVRIFTDILSGPWSWFWDEARPKEELIANSQYFRINSKFILENIKNFSKVHAISNWWKFFVGSILFYGVLPRLIFLIYFLRKKSTKIQEVKESQFKYNEDIASLFSLNDFEQVFLYSILKKIMEIDIENSKESKRESKTKWLKEWADKVDFQFLTSEELSELLSDKLHFKNLKILTMFCEALTFTPYLDASGKTKGEIKRTLILRELEKMLSLCGFNEGEIQLFWDKLETNLNQEKSSMSWLKVLGLAAFSAGAIALTGGAGGVFLAKVLGIAGAAGKLTGAVLLSGGLLMATGNEDEGKKVFVGCGNIFSGLKSAISQPIFEDSRYNESSFLRDLKKLETFVELKFFDPDFYEKLKPSLSKYLKVLEKSSGDAKHKKVQDLIKEIDQLA